MDAQVDAILNIIYSAPCVTEALGVHVQSEWNGGKKTPKQVSQLVKQVKQVIHVSDFNDWKGVLEHYDRVQSLSQDVQVLAGVAKKKKKRVKRFPEQHIIRGHGGFTGLSHIADQLVQIVYGKPSLYSILGTPQNVLPTPRSIRVQMPPVSDSGDTIKIYKQIEAIVKHAQSNGYKVQVDKMPSR